MSTLSCIRRMVIICSYKLLTNWCNMWFPDTKGPSQRGRPCRILQSFVDIFGLLQAFTAFCELLRSFVFFYGFLWAFKVFAGFHGFYGLLRPSAVFSGLLRDITG